MRWSSNNIIPVVPNLSNRCFRNFICSSYCSFAWWIWLTQLLNNLDSLRLVQTFTSSFLWHLTFLSNDCETKSVRIILGNGFVGILQTWLKILSTYLHILYVKKKSGTIYFSISHRVAYTTFCTSYEAILFYVLL